MNPMVPTIMTDYKYYSVSLYNFLLVAWMILVIHGFGL